MIKCTREVVILHFVWLTVNLEWIFNPYLKIIVIHVLFYNGKTVSSFIVFFWGGGGGCFLGGFFGGCLFIFLVVHKALVTLLSCISIIKFKFSLLTLTKHSDTRGPYTIKIKHSIQFDLAKTESIRWWSSKSIPSAASPRFDFL